MRDLLYYGTNPAFYQDIPVNRVSEKQHDNIAACKCQAVLRIGLVWLYSYAEAGVAHADFFSSYRKRKILWGIKTSPSAFLMSTCCLFSLLFPAVPRAMLRKVAGKSQYYEMGPKLKSVRNWHS